MLVELNIQDCNEDQTVCIQEVTHVIHTTQIKLYLCHIVVRVMMRIDGEEVYSTALALRALTAAALAVFLSRFFRPSRLPFRRLAYACMEI